MNFFPLGARAPSGLVTPHFRGLMTTLRHATLGKSPLDELSPGRRDFYLTTHNTYQRQTFMLQVGFEYAIPASERPPNHVDTRIG